MDKTLIQFLYDCQFIQRNNIKRLTKDFRETTAEFFTNNNLKKADQLLDGDKNKINKIDLSKILVFGGATLVVIILLIYSLISANQVFRDHNSTKVQVLWDSLLAMNPIMRFTFIAIYIMFASGIVMNVLRTYEINYIHIFEFDYSKRVQSYTIWASACILSLFWVIALYLSVQKQIQVLISGNPEE